MPGPIDDRWQGRRVRAVRYSGVLMILFGLVGLVMGLLIIDSLMRDFRTSLSVSRSAVASIGQTVEIVQGVVEGTTNSIDAASQSASSAAATTSTAAAGLEDVADFLEEGLPGDIEAIQRALPGAIDAADGIDATLGALSLLGVDYSPEEPFGLSLRRIQTHLASLPGEIRAQSESIRQLVPSAANLADDAGELARSLDDLASGLHAVDELADSYTDTVVEARAAVETTDRSLDRTVLLLRIVTVLASLASVVVGVALLSIHRALEVEAV